MWRTPNNLPIIEGPIGPTGPIGPSQPVVTNIFVDMTGLTEYVIPHLTTPITYITFTNFTLSNDYVFILPFIPDTPSMQGNCLYLFAGDTTYCVNNAATLTIKPANDGKMLDGFNNGSIGQFCNGLGSTRYGWGTLTIGVFSSIIQIYCTGSNWLSNNATAIS